MKYAVEVGSGAMILFHKDWFRYSKVDWGGGDSQRQNVDLISPLFLKK
jgi:hypothetical protein